MPTIRDRDRRAWGSAMPEADRTADLKRLIDAERDVAARLARLVDETKVRIRETALLSIASRERWRFTTGYERPSRNDAHFASGDILAEQAAGSRMTHRRWPFRRNNCASLSVVGPERLPLTQS